MNNVDTLELVGQENSLIKSATPVEETSKGYLKWELPMLELVITSG